MTLSGASPRFCAWAGWVSTGASRGPVRREAVAALGYTATHYPRFERPRNLLGHSSAAFRNVLTRPHRLQRPLLVAPAGISITQWWVHPCLFHRRASGADLLGMSSPPPSSCTLGHPSTIYTVRGRSGV